jgi:hypothetical protein
VNNLELGGFLSAVTSGAQDAKRRDNFAYNTRENLLINLQMLCGLNITQNTLWGRGSNFIINIFLIVTN